MDYKYISEDIREHIIGIAHAIHKNPELSHKEFDTTALIRNELEKLGIELPEENGANLYLAVNSVFAGSIFLEDTIRPEAKESLEKLCSLGVEHSFMLTGDNEKTAKAIAESAGIDNVLADLLPVGKVNAIQSLQQKGQKLLMIGDGINDAPSLVTADVGMALGSGTDIAVESADIVLLGGELEGVSSALKISRRTMRIITRKTTKA